MLLKSLDQDFTHSAVIVPRTGTPTQKFCTANGLGTGPIQITGDYSGAPVDFFYTSDSTFDVKTFQLTITDDTNFNQTDYGAIAGGLINGVKVFQYVAALNVTFPLLSGIAFKQNYEWLLVTSNVTVTSFAGVKQSMAVVFDIEKDYGTVQRLARGDKFIFRVNDNLTSLVSHTMMIRGNKF